MRGLWTMLSEMRAAFLTGTFLVVGLYVASFYNYSLFHSLAELFAVIVGAAAFMVAWNARQTLDNGYLLFMGVVFLFVAGLDVIHSLAYSGSQVFPGHDLNLTTQLSTASRYLQGLAFLAAPLFLGRKVKAGVLLTVLALVFVLLLASVFIWHIFPQTYVEGVGLTAFKKVSEYIVSGAMAVGLLLLVRGRAHFDFKVVYLLYFSILMSLGSGLTFVLSSNSAEPENLVGHLMRILSFGAVYVSLVETGITRPFDLMDRDLRQSEETLRRQARELLALNRVLQSIARTLDLEQALKEIVRQVGAAVESGYTSIVTLNEDGTLGIGADDLQGAPPIHERARSDEVTMRVAATGAPVLVPDVALLPDAGALPVQDGVSSYAALPIKSKNQTVGVLFVHSLRPHAFDESAGLLSAFCDEAAIAIVNARLHRQAARAAALGEADRLKTELLANVSHELRTPLASIKGYATMMLRHYDKIGDAEKRDSLREINAASDRLIKLVENLLRLSRMEAGGLMLVKETLPISPLVHAAIRAMQTTTQRHRLAARLPLELPVVQGDPSRLREVLDNLLDNAIKYSPGGGDIYVEAVARPSELVISVRDQGIGIGKQDMGRIFDRFYQVQQARRPDGGVGLGLSICKHIIEAHGGRIWAESTPGQGSTFSFALPLPPQSSAAPGASAPELRGAEL